MIRSRVVAMLIMVLAVALALAGPAAAVPTLQFDLTPPTSGTVSYAGGAAPLVGSGISVDSVLGVGTPANNGVTATCLSCTLAFSTGNLTGSDATSWFFGGGGSITLTGGVDFPSGPDISTGTTLFLGSWTSAVVTRVGTDFNISGGAFTDTKNDALKTFYGVLGALDWFGNLGLTFTASSGAPPAAFTSSILLTGIALNAVAEPPMLAVLGTLLVGLGLWGRRRRARTLVGA